MFCLGCMSIAGGKKLYRETDRMLESILEGDPILVSDLKEGEVSALSRENPQNPGNAGDVCISGRRGKKSR